MKQTTKMNNFNSILKGGIFFIALSLTTTSCDLFRKAGTTNAPKKDTKKDMKSP